MDFTKIIRNSLEPRLAYHGFKYDEQKPDLVLGSYTFRRTWCQPQHVSIGRIEYDSDAITKISHEEDSPIKVPEEVVLFEDPNYRLAAALVLILKSPDGFAPRVGCGYSAISSLAEKMSKVGCLSLSVLGRLPGSKSTD